MVMNLGFHKMLQSSWVAAQLVASQEGLNSVELVNTLQGSETVGVEDSSTLKIDVTVHCETEASHLRRP
jgi:hypothetical protein